MPLFEIAAVKSKEAKSLFAVAQILSECEQLLELSESIHSRQAREKIIVGPIDEPFDDEVFTQDQLANMFFRCRVAPVNDESHEVLRPETLTECPIDGGNIEVYIRRYVRESEMNSDGGKGDVFLYFLDCVAAISHQFLELSLVANQVRVTRVSRPMGPSFGDMAETVGQGAYIWCILNIEWGEADLLLNRI